MDYCKQHIVVKCFFFLSFLFFFLQKFPGLQSADVGLLASGALAEIPPRTCWRLSKGQCWIYKHAVIRPSVLEMWFRMNTFFPLVGHRLIPSWSSVKELVKGFSISRLPKPHRLKLQLLLHFGSGLVLKCLSPAYLLLAEPLDRRTEKCAHVIFMVVCLLGMWDIMNRKEMFIISVNYVTEMRRHWEWCNSSGWKKLCAWVWLLHLLSIKFEL